MKNLFFTVAVAMSVICFSACGNNSGGSDNGTPSSTNVTNPPDNSSATNPSLADTAYSPDSTKVRKDTMNKALKR
ncbi:MAG: hypothetical protein ABI813_00860 [Bacteroidota bacterium]